MKTLGDMVAIAHPTREQKETLALVLEVARRWEAGEFPISGARSACTAFDRRTAIRILVKHKTADKQLLMRYLDALVADEPAWMETDHGLIDKADLFKHGARAMTNWEGKRVYVFPMAYIGNEPKYPLVHLPPGDERTEREAAIRAAARKG